MDIVFDAFAASAVAAPDNVFLRVPEGPGRVAGDWAYGRVREAVADLAEAYRAAGYGHGHRVALLLGMRPDFFVHFLALNRLGCGVVPINPDYRHDELLYQMAHSEADLAVVTADRIADLERVAAERDMPLPVVDADRLPRPLPGPARPAPHGGAPGPDTECGLLYTSGTTGRPKGCILTNHYYLNCGAWYRDIGGHLTVHPGRDFFYNPLPLHHMNHQAVTATCAMLTRNCLVLPDRFSPARWWPEIAATEATLIHYLGVVPPLLLNQAPVPEERLHRVRAGLGAGVDPELHPVFEQRFGFPLIEVWGMTETGRIFADNRDPRLVTTRAFGRQLPGLEARIVDDEMRDMAPGTPGELVVRHSAAEPRKGFFAGYLKNPEATEAAWAGGWFHSGDVCMMDESGMMYFVDRKKNIIRRSGENIAAAEIEATLQVHDDVAQVAVLAVPDELREEEVMACIVPMPGVAADAALADRLFAWTNDRLAYYKAPGWFLFLDDLPKTSTQKVQKAQIFAPGEDHRQRPGVLDYRGRKKRG